MSTHRVGRRFEELAARYLLRAGWEILERNVRWGRKEVDLVVRRGRVVAFVEVKGRRGPAYGHPLEAITWRKRREIAQVARWWIERRGADLARELGAEPLYRFDALAVLADPLSGVRLEHVEDAWREGG